MKTKTYTLNNFFTANLLVIFAIISLLGFSAVHNYKNISSTITSENYGTQANAVLQIPFIENRGQINEQVKYYAELSGGSFFVDAEGVMTYKLQTGDKTFAIKESLIEANTSDLSAIDPTSAKINYLVGNDKNWRTDLNTYNTINFNNIYEGISLDLVAKRSNIEKIFSVNPGADVSKIQFQVNGSDQLSLNSAEQLVIKSDQKSIKMTAPVAYQEIDGKKSFVDVNYNLTGDNSYGFTIGNYDKNLPLIIDPLLASTYIGGSDWEAAGGLAANITRDSSGKVFISGTSQSSDFPTTTGVYDETYNVGRDGVIMKFNSALTTLEAATFIGGDNNEDIGDISVDSFDNIIIAGQTQSTDFPTTTGAYDEMDVGDNTPAQAEAFISKLSNDLGSLNASTLLGGSGWDRIHGIGIMPGSPEKIVIGGYSMSTDFPIANAGTAFDSTLSNEMDAILAVFDADLTTLEASTFVGGDTAASETGNERIMSLVTTAGGDIYALGRTNETDFPATTGAYDETWNGGTFDAFVVRMQSDLSSTNSYLTYIGGDGNEYPNDIVLSGSAVFISGRATAGTGVEYPTTAGAYDQTLAGAQDAFISSLSLTLDTLNASTFYGGNGTAATFSGDTGYALYAGTGGTYIYLGGQTDSTDLPLTSGIYDQSLSAISDSYIAKFPVSLDSLTAATYIGGCENERLTSIYQDPSDNNLYFAGFTNSTDYHTFNTSYNDTFSGINDYYVSKIDNALTAGAPGKVTELSATGGTLSVALNWCEPPGDPTGYTVEYGTVAGGLFDQTCDTPSCTDATEGATVYNLTNEEYQFKITPTNADGSGEESNIATATPGDPCADIEANQFCGTQEISEYVLTFIDIPDSFNLGTITTGTTLNKCNNTSTLASPTNECSDNTLPDPPGADDLLTVRDERNSGGFVVQVTTQDTFTDGTNTIPLENLYLITSIDETDPEKAGGINYSAGFAGPKTVSAPLYIDESSLDISDSLTYTNGWSSQVSPYESLQITQFGGYPLDLMNGTLSSAEGRVGDMSLFTNFNLTVNYDQPGGDYAIILTYDLTDSTTP